MEDIFTKGNKPGGINSSGELRMVICYILNELEKSSSEITFDKLNYALQSDGLVNYFEFAQGLSRLHSSGHIEYISSRDNEQVLKLTDLGVKTAVTFASDIPVTIRERSLNAVQSCLLKSRIQVENKVLIEEVEDGYTVTLTIPDVGTDLMKLTLFAPTLDVCNLMKDRFLDDPAVSYSLLLELLTGENLNDKNELG